MLPSHWEASLEKQRGLSVDQVRKALAQLSDIRCWVCLETEMRHIEIPRRDSGYIGRLLIDLARSLNDNTPAAVLEVGYTQSMLAAAMDIDS